VVQLLALVAVRALLVPARMSTVAAALRLGLPSLQAATQAASPLTCSSSSSGGSSSSSYSGGSNASSGSSGIGWAATWLQATSTPAWACR
jgi:uncharacterized membrane protein YgcG